MTDNVTADGKPLRSAWRTIAFEPQRAGTAELFVDDQPRMTLPIAGWLTQEQHFYDEDGVGRATGGRQVVPGYLSPAGTVLPLADITFNLTDGSKDSVVRFDIQLNAPDAPPVVHVTIDNQLDIAPKTRTVIRDERGQITKVVEE
jgi:hypothetical protein